ncbi:MAG: hypothetical protein ONA90_08240 [candidate division KSB1 bacterium]|nr:hypothetical protein [candidate division KSB1 bacterium]
MKLKDRELPRSSLVSLAVAMALSVVLQIWLSGRPVHVITVYILFVTLLIVYVQWKYREPILEVEAPKLKRRPAKDKTATLTFLEISLHEFDYAKETAAQAMSDRLTLVNYFLLSAGVVLAGFGVMVSYEGGVRFAYRYEMLIALGLLFNTVGWVYFMQIVRLRQAWCESARSMNHLKQLFAKNAELLPESAANAFRWKMESIPSASKKLTVFYLSALLISLMSAAAISLATIILLGSDLLRKSDELTTYLEFPWKYLVASFGLGIYHLCFQMSMYTALLKETIVSNEKRAEKNQ